MSVRPDRANRPDGHEADGSQRRRLAEVMPGQVRLSADVFLHQGIVGRTCASQLLSRNLTGRLLCRGFALRLPGRNLTGRLPNHRFLHGAFASRLLCRFRHFDQSPCGPNVSTVIVHNVKQKEKYVRL